MKKYNSIPFVANLDSIISKWAEQYEPTDGSEVLVKEWYVDLRQNKVCLIVKTVKDE